MNKRTSKASGRYALSIGINNYPGTDSDLSGCVNDANDWAAELKRRGFQVTKLLDKQATGKAMRAAIAATIAKAGAGDKVVITYSGHGSFVPDLDGDEPDGKDEALCPHDVDTKGVITDDELFELYSARTRGSRLVFLSDSCHSGTVAKFAPIRTPPTTSGRSAPQRTVRFLPPATFLSPAKLRGLSQARGIVAGKAPGRYAGLLMSGCQDHEYSYDAWFQGRPNGAFTFVALRELKKLSKNATYAQWHKAIRKVLPSAQYAQTPNLYGSSSSRKWKVLL